MGHLKLFEQFKKEFNKILENFRHQNTTAAFLDRWQDKVKWLSEKEALNFCPICNSLSLRIKREGSDKYKYLCLRCGKFEITDSFLASNSIKELSLEDRKKVSSYIRSLYETSDSNNSIVLNTYSWNDLLKQAIKIDISPLDKCSKFLLSLNDLSSFLGEKFCAVGLELNSAPSSNCISGIIEVIMKSAPISFCYARDVEDTIFFTSIYYFLEATSYIDNIQEFKFIVDSLSKEGIISLGVDTSLYSESLSDICEVDLLWIPDFSLSLKGIREVSNYLKNQSKLSHKAFIAIQFSKDYESVGKAIEGAIKDAGFDPVQANKVPYADFAMDWILNRIKESRFIVAELSSGNNGVYFEAGYALGKGIPVITCTKKITDEKGRDITFDNVHFDLRQYNTIVYESEEELKEKLRERIIHVVGYGPHYKERN